MIDTLLAAIRQKHPAARFGCNQDDEGVFEAWIKVDRVALAFRSGVTLEEAVTKLVEALGTEMKRCTVCGKLLDASHEC